MHGAVSPPNNTGDGLRMAMAHGADLANMGEAWWVPIVQIPGDTIDGHQRSRSVRLERTRPRSIIVNRLGRRFVNEAGEYNSMAGAFHYLDPREGYVNDPAWIVFDSQHLKRYGFLGVDPDGPVPDWFCESADLTELAAKTGIAPDGLARTIEAWNHNVGEGADPDFGRGSSAYDGYWGDDHATTLAGKTLGPIDTAPFYAVPVSVGAMGTKGGPRTDRDGRVLHVSGEPIPGLFAAGNAMGGVTGRPTAVPAEPSARQWFSATAPGTPRRPGVGRLAGRWSALGEGFSQIDCAGADRGDHATVDQQIGAGDERRGRPEQEFGGGGDVLGGTEAPSPELSTIARISVPDSLSSSSRPIAVEMTPGLMELIRAPRSPQARPPRRPESGWPAWQMDRPSGCW